MINKSILRTFILIDYKSFTDKKGNPYLKVQLDDLKSKAYTIGLVFHHLKEIKKFNRGERVWVTAKDKGDILIIESMESV